MSKGPSFNGFPEETVRFYRELSKNNDRAWFDAHKDTYDKDMYPIHEWIVGSVK